MDETIAPATSGKKRRKNSNSGITRQELLDVGREMLLEEGFDETLHLRLTEVTKRAGRTTGAAYQVWPKQMDFHKDLAQYVIERDAFAAAAIVSEEAATALANEASLSEVIRVGSADYIRQQLAGRSHEIFMRYAVIAMHDANMRAQLGPGLDAFHTSFKDLYGGLLEHYGRDLRPEYTLDDLTVLLSALADGYVMRAGIAAESLRSISRAEADGDAKEWSLFACAIEAIVLAFTVERNVG